MYLFSTTTPTVYIYHLTASDHYIGFSENPVRRWRHHAEKRTAMSRSAASRGITPVLVWSQPGGLKKEAWLKGQSNRFIAGLCTVCTPPLQVPASVRRAQQDH
jgi:predicted GIY-YIG superfamily endonuclease